MKYYEACRLARIKRGIPLREVAEATRYTVQNVSAFEHGKVSNSTLYNYYILYIIPREYIAKYDTNAPTYSLSDIGKVADIGTEAPPFIMDYIAGSEEFDDIKKHWRYWYGEERKTESNNTD